MDLSPGDILKLRKKHPCGSDRFEILRAGMDVRLKCLGCGKQFLLLRRDAERSIRDLVPARRDAENGGEKTESFEGGTS